MAKEKDVERLTPFVAFEYVDVFFGTENTDVAIEHTLLTETPEAVQWTVVSLNNNGMVYRDGRVTRLAWQAGRIFLRCSAANTTARLLLSVPTEVPKVAARPTGLPVLTAIHTKGNWTPTIGGSTSESGQVYSAQAGTYHKFDDLVIAHFDLTLSTLGTITGVVQLKGLPFTAHAGMSIYGSELSYFTNLTTAVVALTATPVGGSAAATLNSATAAAVSLNQLVQGDLSNTTRLAGVLIYNAA